MRRPLLLVFRGLYHSRASKRSSKDLSKQVPKDYARAGNGYRQRFGVRLIRFDVADSVQANQRNQRVKWAELNDPGHCNGRNRSDQCDHTNGSVQWDGRTCGYAFPAPAFRCPFFPLFFCRRLRRRRRRRRDGRWRQRAGAGGANAKGLVNCIDWICNKGNIVNCPHRGRAHPAWSPALLAAPYEQAPGRALPRLRSNQVLCVCYEEGVQAVEQVRLRAVGGRKGGAFDWAADRHLRSRLRSIGKRHCAEEALRTFTQSWKDALRPLTLRIWVKALRPFTSIVPPDHQLYHQFTPIVHPSTQI
eukprot:gene17898-biopygen11557